MFSLTQRHLEPQQPLLTGMIMDVMVYLREELTAQNVPIFSTKSVNVTEQSII